MVVAAGAADCAISGLNGRRLTAYSQTGSAAASQILCDFSGLAVFRAVLGEGKFVTTVRTYCEPGTNRVQSFHCQSSQASGGGRTFRALRIPVIRSARNECSTSSRRRIVHGQIESS